MKKRGYTVTESGWSEKTWSVTIGAGFAVENGLLYESELRLSGNGVTKRGDRKDR